MNIIANTCVGAYLMRDINKHQFENPFCWNIIDYESMYKIIKNYTKLKTFSINPILEKNEYDEFFASIILNNDIKIQYVHYLHEKQRKRTKNINDTYCADPLNYAVTKYNDRLQNINNTPIFILQFQPKHHITGNKEKFLSLINNIKTPEFPIIVISPFKIKNKNILNIVTNNDNLLSSPKNLSVYLKPIILNIKSDLKL